MKDIELRLISELLKNSRRSDRELSKVLNVSQPTVSRTLAKLKKEGFIRRYTILPDFAKLGYELLAITFVKLKFAYLEEERTNIRKAVEDAVEQSKFGIVMLERGIGLNSDACIISIYRDYSEYAEHKEVIKRFPFTDMTKTETFLIDLKDSVRYRPLSFDIIAMQLIERKKRANLT